MAHVLGQHAHVSVANQNQPGLRRGTDQVDELQDIQQPPLVEWDGIKILEGPREGLGTRLR